MPNFKGFSTIGRAKKFTLTDRDLIKRDLLNALLIRAGTMPGLPEVGTNIWGYVFDPLDDITKNKIKNEMTRIIAADSRIVLHELIVTSADNIVRVHVSISLKPDEDVDQFYLNFIEAQNTVTVS